MPLPPAQPLSFKDYMVEQESGHLTERFDGNNVKLEEELGKLAHARGRFKLASMLMNRKIRLLNEAIRS
jgi:flagellar basal body rod protein FlgB